MRNETSGSSTENGRCPEVWQWTGETAAGATDEDGGERDADQATILDSRQWRTKDFRGRVVRRGVGGVAGSWYVETRALGTWFLYSCPACGDTAKVSGGEDGGMVVSTTTILCETCQKLYDVVTATHRGEADRCHLPQCPRAKRHVWR